MTQEATAEASETENGAESIPDRTQLLGTLSNAIDELEYKIENGRVRNPENERVKVQYYRTRSVTWYRHRHSSSTTLS